MLMLSIMIVTLGPMLAIVLCFDPPIRDFSAIGMAVVSGVGVVYRLDRIKVGCKVGGRSRLIIGTKSCPGVFIHGHPSFFDGTHTGLQA